MSNRWLEQMGVFSVARDNGALNFRLPVILAVTLSLLTLLLVTINPMLVVGCVFTLVASVYALFRPWSSFLLYLVSIQFIDFVKRLSLLFGNPSPVEWYGIVILPDIVLLACTLGLFVSPMLSKSPKFLLVEKIIWIYVFWYTLRTIWTVAPLGDSVAQWKSFVPYIVCFYVGAKLVDSLPRFEQVLKLLAIITALASVYAVFQIVVGLTDFERRWLFQEYTRLLPDTILYGDDIPRAFSFYSDPWTFGYTTAWVLTMLLFWRKTFVAHSWNSMLLIGVLIVGLLSTVARGTWTLASIGVLAYIWIKLLKTRMRKIVFVSSAAIMVLVGLSLLKSLAESTSPFVARALFTATYTDRSESFDNLITHGIVTSVAGNGVAAAPGSANLAHSGNLGSYLVHDYLTSSLLEVGWIGFGLFILIVFLAVQEPYPLYLTPLSAGLKSMVIGIPMMAVIFGGVMLDRATTTLFWLSMGMMCGDSTSIQDDILAVQRSGLSNGRKRHYT